MKKLLIVFVLVALALSSCSVIFADHEEYPSMGIVEGPLRDGGEIEPGVYQNEIVVSSMYVKITTSAPVVTVGGSSSLTIGPSGIYWVLLDCSALSDGDTFSITVGDSIRRYEVKE